MRKNIGLFVLPLLALVLAACNLPGNPTVSPFSTPTPDLAQTLTAIVNPTGITTEPAATQATSSNATATSFPTLTTAPVTSVQATAAPVTNTPVPTPTSGGVPVVQITPISPFQTPTTGGVVPTAIPNNNRTRIAFAPYATNAAEFGTINGGTTKEFVLRVGAGQVMMVQLSSGSGDVFLRIYAPATGQILLDTGMGAGQTSWQGRIPATQDYVIALVSRGGNTNYSLGVTIPENIIFDPGAISASRSYPIRAREMHTFLLRAAAGQTMTLTLTPSDQSVLLGFYGYQDGQPYLRTAAGLSTWTGPVPASQDYVIQVQSVIDTDTNFKLDVKIQ